MFMDIAAPGGPGGEPHIPTCKSCQGLIAPGETVETVTFAANEDEKLQQLNGDYHAKCAAPILSVKRAFDMLKGMRGH